MIRFLLPLLLLSVAIGHRLGAQEVILHKWEVRHVVAPSVCIGLGVLATFTPTMDSLNTRMRSNVQRWRNESFMAGRRMKVDNVLQYVPVAAALALSVCGVEGQHTFPAFAARGSIAYLSMATVTLSVKTISHVRRPDERSSNSFMSGHTATAFTGAELLRLEYRDVSRWIGVGGYAVAAATGMLRIYNNRHWIGDVLAGAGVGILSAHFAYWFADRVFKPGTVFGSKIAHHDPYRSYPYTVSL